MSLAWLQVDLATSEAVSLVGDGSDQPAMAWLGHILVLARDMFFSRTWRANAQEVAFLRTS